MEKNELIGANGKYGRIINIWRCTVIRPANDSSEMDQTDAHDGTLFNAIARGELVSLEICRSNGIITILSVSKCQATFPEIYEN